jgi:hypothetical protein
VLLLQFGRLSPSASRINDWFSREQRSAIEERYLLQNDYEHDAWKELDRVQEDQNVNAWFIRC